MWKRKIIEVRKFSIMQYEIRQYRDTNILKYGNNEKIANKYEIRQGKKI